MENLNYHHLYYFWVAARTGGVAAAARELLISQPTISTQIKSLEAAVGEKLFRRAGRGLALTEAGHVAFEYANEIFGLGRELLGVLRSESKGRRPRLVIGVTDALPKIVTQEILAPVVDRDDDTLLTVLEGKLEDLLGELALHRLDLVLSDVPAPPDVSVQAFHHELGSSGLAFVARPRVARRLQKGFPASLDGAPVVLPTGNTAMRRSLDKWFAQHEVRPVIRAEVEDPALLKVLAAEGSVAAPVCLAFVEKTASRYGLSMFGEAEGCVERFFAITTERRLKGGAVRELTAAARGRLARES